MILVGCGIGVLTLIDVTAIVTNVILVVVFVAQGSYFVSSIAVATVTSVGGVTLLFTGGLGHHTAIAVRSNIFLAANITVVILVGFDIGAIFQHHAAAIIADVIAVAIRVSMGTLIDIATIVADVISVSISMASCGNNFLSGHNVAAFGALLAFGKASCCTAGRHCGNSLLCVVCAEVSVANITGIILVFIQMSRSRNLLRISVVATGRTGVRFLTFCSTSGLCCHFTVIALVDALLYNIVTVAGGSNVAIRKVFGDVILKGTAADRQACAVFCKYRSVNGTAGDGSIGGITFVCCHAIYRTTGNVHGTIGYSDQAQACLCADFAARNIHSTAAAGKHCAMLRFAVGFHNAVGNIHDAIILGQHSGGVLANDFATGDIDGTAGGTHGDIGGIASNDLARLHIDRAVVINKSNIIRRAIRGQGRAIDIDRATVCPQDRSVAVYNQVCTQRQLTASSNREYVGNSSGNRHTFVCYDGHILAGNGDFLCQFDALEQRNGFVVVCSLDSFCEGVVVFFTDLSLCGVLTITYAVLVILMSRIICYQSVAVTTCFIMGSVAVIGVSVSIVRTIAQLSLASLVVTDVILRIFIGAGARDIPTDVTLVILGGFIGVSSYVGLSAASTFMPVVGAVGFPLGAVDVICDSVCSAMVTLVVGIVAVRAGAHHILTGVTLVILGGFIGVSSFFGLGTTSTFMPVACFVGLPLGAVTVIELRPLIRNYVG